MLKLHDSVRVIEGVYSGCRGAIEEILLDSVSVVRLSSRFAPTGLKILAYNHNLITVRLYPNTKIYHSIYPNGVVFGGFYEV